MRRQRISRLPLLLIVPLTLLVFPVRLIWTQEKPSPSETPIQVASLAAQFVAVPEAKIRFHPPYNNLLPFASNQGQPPSLMRLRTLDNGSHPLFARNNALPALWQLAKTDEVQVKADNFIRNLPSSVSFRTLDMGYRPLSANNNTLPELWQLARRYELQAKANRFTRNTPIEWLSAVNPNAKVHSRTPDPSGQFAYYVHRIPWASQIILGIGEKAKVHPRVIYVLKVVDPRDLRFEDPLPRGSAHANSRKIACSQASFRAPAISHCPK